MQFFKKIIDFFLYRVLGRKRLTRWQKETIKKKSKKYKLPKKYWEKGKSKFLMIRLKEERVNHINLLKPNKNYVQDQATQ